jgi:hypothetical protein
LYLALEKLANMDVNKPQAYLLSSEN